MLGKPLQLGRGEEQIQHLMCNIVEITYVIPTGKLQYQFSYRILPTKQKSYPNLESIMIMKLVTESWRERKAEEKRAFEAGEITADDCYMDRLFPDSFIDRTEILLKAFTVAIKQCPTSASDFPQVMRNIETLVLGLNQINEDFDYGVIETGEREELCEFIDQVITSRGIDIEALAASKNCDRYELTDEWRDW